MATPSEKNEVLDNWAKLNEYLMAVSEDQVVELLTAEKAGKARLRVMLRIFNRLNKLRATREKLELGRLARG